MSDWWEESLIGFYDEIERLRAEIERLRAENAPLLALLREARDYMHNDFEPDNQSRLWRRIDAALAAEEQKNDAPSV